MPIARKQQMFGAVKPMLLQSVLPARLLTQVPRLSILATQAVVVVMVALRKSFLNWMSLGKLICRFILEAMAPDYMRCKLRVMMEPCGILITFLPVLFQQPSIGLSMSSI